MLIRPLRRDDAPSLAQLSATCLRGEADFVLNPLWETEAELFAEFDRFGIDPETHVLVAENESGAITGLGGFLRFPGSREAGLLSPIVARGERGHGTGGKLLRASLELGSNLGIRLVTASIGTRNRSGYALLSSLGFLPVRQHFLMRCDERPVPGPMPVEGLELESAKPGDRDAIADLYAASGFAPRSPERLAEIMADGQHKHAMARVGGKVVAFTELETHWPKRAWLAFVGVAPELRNRGVGSALVTWALARHFDEGAETILLMISPGNREAVRAYEKVGFRLHRNIDVMEKIL